MEKSVQFKGLKIQNILKVITGKYKTLKTTYE